MSHETLQELDELIKEIRGDVAIYSLVTPENETVERERFLAGETEMPDFTYSGGIESSEEIRRDLERLNSDVEVDEAVQQLYRDSIREGEALLDIAENIGDTAIVQPASRNIYGEPSDGAINWAEETLSQDEIHGNDQEGSFGAGAMVETVDRTLNVLGLDWDVEIADKSIFSVNAANQIVSVPSS